MVFKDKQWLIEMIDDPTYTLGSSDNLQTYARQYDFAEGYSPSSKHGIWHVNDGSMSCILAASGGATGIHKHTVVIGDDRCFIAVGPFICSLELPTFDLIWKQRVDMATCFGVHFSEEHNCLISHGELTISRVELSGQIVWSKGWMDIFTGSLDVLPKFVQAVDFYGRKYRFDILTGKPELVE